MLYITVHLYGRTGTPGEFRDYESKALNIFKRHGGEVLVAYTPAVSKDQTGVPDEIQILKIASQSDFEGFMGDSDRVALAAERERVIRKTEVFLSKEIVRY
ncbi:MAG: hypothetical protein ABI036_10795 [Fibrobacteria bacterium]